MYRRLYLIQFMFLCLLSLHTNAQVAIKTSVTQLATSSLNAELSVPVGKCVSLHLPVIYNPWVFHNNTRFQRLTCLPGVRWWTKRTHCGPFVSFFGVASRFQIGGWFNHRYRYDGEAYGAGFGVGYSWVLSPRFNIDTELGLGLGYADYDKCLWEKNSRRIKSCSGFRAFPAKVDVSLCYFF